MTGLEVVQAFSNYSDEFQSRFPEVSQDNFVEVANGLLNYPVFRNEFCSYLIDKIGRTYVNAMIAKNPLGFLRGEELPFGAVIEDMFVEIAKATQFDPEGKDTLDRKVPDVRVLYYTKNVNLTYKTSISDKELKKAFFDVGQMDALLERITAALYEAARHDMFVLTKELVANYDGFTYVTIDAFDDTEATAKANGKAIKGAVVYAGFDSRAYNASGVMNNIPDGEGLLLLRADASISLDFDYLANVFNLSKADLAARTVIVDNFNDRDDILAVYCSESWFQIHYLYDGIETQRNAAGRFTNYFLVQEAIYAASKFKNAIAFTTKATVEITFDANGGGGSMPTRTAIANSPMTLPFNSFTPPSEGQTFVGWGLTSTASGGDVMSEISDYTPTAAATVYAIWSPAA